MTHTTILFVCTGNTCRSPMAQVIAQQVLAQQRGMTINELEAKGFRIISAGVFAGEGSPASDEAIQAMQKEGLDLTNHRSRMLTAELLREADRVYCMTQSHKKTVLAMMPELGQRVMCLDAAGDIIDPMGSSLSEYQRCAGQIRAAIAARFKEFFR